jgi:hypothetical protein
VDLGVALVAGSEASEVVEVCESALDDPSLATEPGAVRPAAASDDRRDAECPQQPSVLVVVIATVGEDTVGLLSRPAALAGDWSSVERLDQRQQLCDVVAVAAGQADGERDAARVDEQVML